MKSIVLSLLSLMVISPVTLPLPTGSPVFGVFGVFVATSPCDVVSGLLLKIPQTANCELIKWNLTLYREPSNLAPTTYKLSYAYGLPEQGTNGMEKGGTKVERKGRWSIVRGTKRNPEAVVYQLESDKPQESISLQVLDDNLLHLLDREGNLLVGNAGWSYTLNRVGDSVRHTQQSHPPSVTRANPSSPMTSALPVKTDSSILGAFVGRSPCLEVARELNKSVTSDCSKLKWGLTLYHDPITHVPTTYQLKGTFYRKQIGEGRWAIVKGAKSNPEAVIYQLDPDKAEGSLFFLKADDNILFFLDKERNLMKGNGDFSYTLNRTNDVLKN